MQWIFSNPWVMPLGDGAACADVCIFLTIDTLQSYILVRNPKLQDAVAELVCPALCAAMASATDDGHVSASPPQHDRLAPAVGRCDLLLLLRAQQAALAVKSAASVRLLEHIRSSSTLVLAGMLHLGHVTSVHGRHKACTCA